MRKATYVQDAFLHIRLAELPEKEQAVFKDKTIKIMYNSLELAMASKCSSEVESHSARKYHCPDSCRL